jgi:hypothetical protein
MKTKLGNSLGETRFGNSLWKLALATHFGNSLWQLALGTLFGNSLWELSLAAYVNKFYFPANYFT